MSLYGNLSVLELRGRDILFLPFGLNKDLIRLTDCYYKTVGRWARSGRWIKCPFIWEPSRTHTTLAFNGDAWQTVRADGIRGMSLRIVVRVDNDSGNENYFWDNIKVEREIGSEWSGVPGISNITVNTDQTVAHTNNAIGACGFYRVRARLE